MNRLLCEILRTGKTLLASGEAVEVTSHIDETRGALLQRVIRAVRPQVVVEVGLAFGISTLYILEVLHEIGGKKLIGMDPFQNDSYWRGGGLYNVRRAGYESLYEFHEEASQTCLPLLASQKERIQLAFIDGWHTFDHALVDFFYIDRLLETDGLVVFDDVEFPSIKKV